MLGAVPHSCRETQGTGGVPVNAPNNFMKATLPFSTIYMRESGGTEKPCPGSWARSCAGPHAGGHPGLPELECFVLFLSRPPGQAATPGVTTWLPRLLCPVSPSSC